MFEKFETFFLKKVKMFFLNFHKKQKFFFVSIFQNFEFCLDFLQICRQSNCKIFSSLKFRFCENTFSKWKNSKLFANETSKKKFVFSKLWKVFWFEIKIQKTVFLCFLFPYRISIEHQLRKIRLFSISTHLKNLFFVCKLFWLQLQAAISFFTFLCILKKITKNTKTVCLNVLVK